MKKPGAWIDPAGALAVPLSAVLVILAVACGGGGETGNCVEVFEFEGTVVLENFTRSECEEHCATIGRALSCGFQSTDVLPTGVTAREEFASRDE